MMMKSELFPTIFHNGKLKSQFASIALQMLSVRTNVAMSSASLREEIVAARYTFVLYLRNIRLAHSRQVRPFFESKQSW